MVLWLQFPSWLNHWKRYSSNWPSLVGQQSLCNRFFFVVSWYWIFCWYKGFLHWTESDPVLYLFIWGYPPMHKMYGSRMRPPKNTFFHNQSECTKLWHYQQRVLHCSLHLSEGAKQPLSQLKGARPAALRWYQRTTFETIRGHLIALPLLALEGATLTFDRHH